MQGRLKFTYLGIDSFPGKKDPTKTFHNLTMLQGSEIVKIFLDPGQEVLFQEMQKFDELVCVCSWSLGTDKYGAKINYKLLSMEPLEAELPFDDKTPVDAGNKFKVAEKLDQTSDPKAKTA